MKLLHIKKNFDLTTVIYIILIFGVVGLGVYLFISKHQKNNDATPGYQIVLPQPSFESTVSVEEALKNRRSVREYKDQPISMHELSQILWAAQGITSDEGFRTAPSAGGLYPLELYVVSQNVAGLERSIYKFHTKSHSLDKIINTNKIEQIVSAANNQEFIGQAPVVIIITGVLKRTTQKYNEIGERYVYIEAGHVAQNIYLQTYTLGLDTVTIGGFDTEKIQSLLNLPEGEEPIYIIPIGK
ncbi:SagB/ThcOx family dehydrogenase [Patescibacteria group bacterium]|nr:SagB/ThcOx family dehydrogenase [Patescibacteria group bacterium]